MKALISAILATVIGGLLLRYLSNQIHTNNEALTIEFHTDKQKVRDGDPVRLRWDVTGSDQVIIDHQIGAVASHGERIVYPKESMTWTLIARNGNRESEEQVSVDVLKTSGEIDVSPATIMAGQHAILRWKSTAESAVLFVEPEGTAKNVKASDFQDVSPPSTSRYRIEFNGPGGKAVSETTLTVQPLVKPSTTVTLSANAVAGEATRVQWTGAYTIATHLKCFDVDSDFKSSDSAEIRPQSAGTVECSLTATGPGGTEEHKFTVQVAEKPAAPPPPSKPVLRIDRIDGLDGLYGREQLLTSVREQLERSLSAYADGQSSVQVLINFQSKPHEFLPGKQYQVRTQAKVVVWLRTSPYGQPRQGFGERTEKMKFVWPGSTYEANPYLAMEQQTISGALSGALLPLQR